MIAERGVYRFRDVMVQSTPGEKIKFFVEVRNVVSFTGSEVPYATNPQVYSVSIENCAVGQAYDEDFKCTWCPPQTYLSQAPRVITKCKPCPDNAHCFGGASVAPRKNWWRPSPQTIDFVSCFNKDSCL